MNNLKLFLPQSGNALACFGGALQSGN